MSTTESENEELVRELLERVWENGETETYDEDFVSEGYVFRHQTDKRFTVDEWRSKWDEYHDAFDDVSLDIEQVLSDGEKVVVRCRLGGTHTDTFQGVEPTGRVIETVGIGIFTVLDGVIFDAWYVEDVKKFFDDLHGE